MVFAKILALARVRRLENVQLKPTYPTTRVRRTQLRAIYAYYVVM